MSMSSRERFWDILCDYRHLLRLFLLFTTALLVLTLVSIGIGDQRTDAYVISVVTVGILVGTILPAGYCLWRCGNRTGADETTAQ